MEFVVENLILVRLVAIAFYQVRSKMKERVKFVRERVTKVNTNIDGKQILPKPKMRVKLNVPSSSCVRRVQVLPCCWVG